MFPYIPNTKQDEERMLEALGIEDVDELFRDIPDSIRLNRRLNIQPPLSELEVSKRVKGLARKNISTEDAICFRRVPMITTSPGGRRRYPGVNSIPPIPLPT